tara:strand:- start:261 stop:389 length:129 start_codon:yes stop_codon:yes gene_type:complete
MKDSLKESEELSFAFSKTCFVSLEKGSEELQDERFLKEADDL